MRKFISLAVLFVLFFGTSFSYLKAANEIADTDDLFQVQTPSPKQKVKGALVVKWLMYDDEQGSIPFTANIYDTTTCSDVNYGSITSNSNGTSSKITSNTIVWDSTATQTTAPLNDGEYCLKICAAMKVDGIDYSVCNGRPILLINNNSLPNFTNFPSNVTLTEGQNWEFQLNASDPDGDSLTYRLVTAPTFLGIDAATGRLYLKSLPTLANNIAQEEYTVVVAVDDGLSGAVTRSFKLTIVNDVAPTVTPTTGNNVNQNNYGSNQSSNIIIYFPEENSVLKGTENKLKWKVTDVDGVEKILLSYSSNGIDWIEFANLRGDKTEYNWDVTSVPEGTYYLQVTVVDTKNSIVTHKSPRFSVLNNLTEEELSSPLIINVEPSEGKTQEIVNEIKGNLVPSNGAKIDPKTFKLLLDGKDITADCNVDDLSFSCPISENLNKGKHSIQIEIKDSNDKKAEHTSSFNIGNPSEVIVDNNKVTIAGREFSKSTLLVLTLLCCTLSILVLVPWILYSMWRRDDGSDDYYHDSTTTETVTTAPTYDPNAYNYYPQTTPEVTTNYYYPDPTQSNYTYPVIDPNAVYPTAPTPDVNINYPTYNYPVVDTNTPIQPMVPPTSPTPTANYYEPTATS